MAQPPRREPAAGPAGIAFGAMAPEDRRPPQGANTFPAFSPFAGIDAVRNAPRDTKTIALGDRMYQAVDTGRAIKLVPFDPLYTPAERQARTDGVVRALFMARHPFGTLAYGGATMAGAPQPTRDAMLLAGGLLDDVGTGRATRSPVGRPRSLAPESQVPSRRPNMRLGQLNANGQATGVTATIEPQMLGTGKKVSRRIKPAGYVSSKAPYKHDRGHLAARQLGGPHNKPENFVTLSRSANSGKMRDFEDQVAGRVRAGEVIEYMAKPIYEEGILAPSAVWLTAFGHNGPPIARLIRNPAGRRR